MQKEIKEKMLLFLDDLGGQRECVTESFSWFNTGRLQRGRAANMPMAAPSAPKVPSKLGQVPSTLSKTAPNLGKEPYILVVVLLHKVPPVFTWPPHLKILVSIPGKV